MLAELAVGRIIRARNPSSAATGLDVLGFEDGLAAVEFARAIELRVDAVPGFAVPAEGRDEVRPTALAPADAFKAGFGWLSCFAADEAVGADRCDEILIGCVGDFGCGLVEWLGLLKIQR